MSELPEIIRAFIAVRIPEGVRTQMADLQSQLKSSLPDVSWTRPEAMHVTLQFLGDVRSSHVPRIEEALRHSTRETPSFELLLGRVGSFGNRVVWVGIEQGADKLQRLAGVVNDATRDLTEHVENRDFNPHVTLGRCRRGARGVGAALRQASAPKFQPWTVDDFRLIRSELSPHGSRYTTLATFPFKATR